MYTHYWSKKILLSCKKTIIDIQYCFMSSIGIQDLKLAYLICKNNVERVYLETKTGISYLCDESIFINRIIKKTHIASYIWKVSYNDIKPKQKDTNAHHESFHVDHIMT